MAPLTHQHRRTHNLLLFSKLLDYRDASSPFTLVLDNLEQSARPLVAEKLKRKPVGKASVIYVSLETIKKPQHVDNFVEAWKYDSQTWQRTVQSLLKEQSTQKKLLVFDNLNALSAQLGANLPAILAGFVGPTTSLFAVYHTDVPSIETSHTNGYTPPALTLLKYLATTIITTHSLDHVLAQKAARDRSHEEPSFGLEEGVDGVLQSLGANGNEGVVLEIEHRRKSGRGVREWYILPIDSAKALQSTGSSTFRESVTLLEDHPAYRTSTPTAGDEDQPSNATFELGLTEKQRMDREGVVLPYFDAQQGGGDGGRILYDMGEDDDFDEEEDEI